jgi:hypothetical protein
MQLNTLRGRKICLSNSSSKYALFSIMVNRVFLKKNLALNYFFCFDVLISKKYYKNIYPK